MTDGAYRLVVAHVEVLALAPILVLLVLLAERRGSGAPWAGAIRAVIVVLLVAAIARPALTRAGEGAQVVLVDRSASVREGAADARLAALVGPDAVRSAMPFGDARSTLLADAIDLAARALPAGGRIVVIGDGQVTGPNPLEAARRARDAGIRIDVAAVPVRAGPDAAVAAVVAPTAWRHGNPVPVAVTMRSTEPMSGTLEIYADGERVTELPVHVGGPGEPLTIETHVTAPGAGAVQLSAAVNAQGDRHADNDVGYAVTHVAPPPRVLVVGEAEGAVELADALGRSGATVAIMGPERLPGRLSALDPWDVMVLVDVSARRLGLDQLVAVEAFVSDLGRGLVLTGGRQSFLLGGWEATPLESLAPVRLETPPRDERDPVALLLLIDQSASMGGADSTTGISKLDLAREAAVLSAEVLHPGDTVGVVSYDDAARWVVPPRTVGSGTDLAEVEAALAALQTGGGTRIANALELGLPELAVVDVPTRHAVLLSDGRDFNPDQSRYDAVVRDARAAGVTLSTIAVGFDADRDLLLRLARLGRGRYHSADTPSDLPRLTVEESEILRARAEQTGDFWATLPSGPAHPALAGLDLARLPALRGYLATSRRDEAHVVLETPRGDPLLATWGFGLGRVAAWLSDTGEAWAGAWRGNEAAEAFWARLVGYAAPAPALGPPGVRIDSAGDTFEVSVDAVDGRDRPMDFADASLVITGTQGVQAIELNQTGPGLYGGAVAASESGAVPAMVRVETEEGSRTVPVGLVSGPPDEVMPARGHAERLAALAAAGGGRLIAGDDGLAVGANERREIALWPWLLVAAAAIWPVEVARVLGFDRTRLRLPRWRSRRSVT